MNRQLSVMLSGGRSSCGKTPKNCKPPELLSANDADGASMAWGETIVQRGAGPSSSTYQNHGAVHGYLVCFVGLMTVLASVQLLE